MHNPAKNPRLDDWLVNNRHYGSRARARDAILRGCVFVNGTPARKVSAKVLADSKIEIDDPAQHYVSRAALKLVHALEVTGYSPKEKTVLDIGASTGGFCQVLLESGAAKVFAIDVGHDQMDKSLVGHPRLYNIEGLNARDLTLNDLGGEPPQFITCDVSFISLKLALPPALDLAAQGAIGIFLVKPQFEVGKDGLGKGGIVRDEKLAGDTARSVRDWLDDLPEWRVTHFLSSPVLGGDGNKEYLMAAVKHG